MSDVQKHEEQSMDDILASIRRIISDDSAVEDTAGNSAKQPAASTGAEASATSINEEPQASDFNTEVAPGGLRRSDDLSDILESGKSEARADARARDVSRDDAGLSGRESGSDDKAWSFDEAEANPQALQRKLASLDQQRKGSELAAGRPRRPSADLKLPDAGPADAALGGTNETNWTVSSRLETLLPTGSDGQPVEPEISVASPEAGTTQEAESKSSGLFGVPSIDEKSPSDERAPVQLDAAPNTQEADHPPAASLDPEESGTSEANPSVDAAQETSSASNNLEGRFDGQQTLESVVAGMLRPMLSEWLDANLPRIIEDRLDRELAKRTGDRSGS